MHILAREERLFGTKSAKMMERELVEPRGSDSEVEQEQDFSGQGHPHVNSVFV